MSAFSDHQIAHSAARQRTILESAIDLVSPVGGWVYSTCTFAYSRTKPFLPGFASGCWLATRGVARVVLMANAWFGGCYRLWPHRDRCAGGFAAALIRC